MFNSCDVYSSIAWAASFRGSENCALPFLATYSNLGDILKNTKNTKCTNPSQHTANANKYIKDFVFCTLSIFYHVSQAPA